jgi:hypothetical protein
MLIMIKGGKEVKINKEESYIEINNDDLKEFYIKQIEDIQEAINRVESDTNIDEDLLDELKKGKLKYQKELDDIK